MTKDFLHLETYEKQEKQEEYIDTEYPIIPVYDYSDDLSDIW